MERTNSEEGKWSKTFYQTLKIFSHNLDLEKQDLNTYSTRMNYAASVKLLKLQY